MEVEIAETEAKEKKLEEDETAKEEEQLKGKVEKKEARAR